MRFYTRHTPYTGVATMHPITASLHISRGGSNSKPQNNATVTNPPPPLNIPAARLPQHIAVIMDGNGRWAQKQGLPVAYGHQRGVDTLRRLVQCAVHWQLKIVTVYALSSENFLRPPTEVEFLLKLFEKVLQDEINDLIEAGVRLHFIGDVETLPINLRQAISKAEEKTCECSRLILNIAINYGSRNDITSTVRQLAQEAAEGQLNPDDITPELITHRLSTHTNIAKNNIYPDLVIRSGGERRLSNFLLWEAAYAELYFSDSMWPEFGDEELVEAMQDYSSRQRRFGQR